MSLQDFKEYFSEKPVDFLPTILQCVGNVLVAYVETALAGCGWRHLFFFFFFFFYFFSLAHPFLPYRFLL